MISHGLPIGFLAPGFGEIVMIALACLLLFGARDTPALLRRISRMLLDLRRTADEFKREIMSSASVATDSERTPPAESPPALPAAPPASPDQAEEKGRDATR